MNEPYDSDHPSLRIARHFLARSTDLEAVTSLDGRFLWVSPGWVEVLGWTEAELNGRAFIELVHPDDVQRTSDEGRAFQNRSYTVELFENRYRTKQGQYRWLQWNAMRVGEEILCRVRDVTDRKQSEDSALERLRWLKMAEGLGKVGFWRVDLSDPRPKWSDEVYRIHGLEPGVPVSLEDAFDAYHPADRTQVRENVDHAISRKGEWQLEARIVQPTGEVRLTRSSGRCELDPTGNVVAIYGVLRDITEQRRMEESLRQSERMASLGTLASAMAHEINNPLTYILANIDFLTTELAESANRDQFEMLVEARRGAEQVRKIVSGLKAFSRIGSSVRERIDIRETVDLSLRMVGNELRHKARLETELAAVPEVSGDQSELLQVLTNLLVNAAQAIPDGDEANHLIRVVTRQIDQEVEITITDSGVGLPNEAPGRIFEPFFTTKPQGEGTGLGLSVSLGIVERMRGKLELAPAEVRGTRALIRLPIATGEDESSEPALEADSVRPLRSRVMIVDDDTRVVRAMKRMLSRYYDVETFEDGRAALRRMGDELPDVVLCDLMMPGFSGIELYHEASRTVPAVIERMVFITGGAFGAEARGFLESIRNPVLEKPIDFKMLHELIQERTGES